MPGILGAADLANNIASATQGLAVAFGLANPDPQFIEFPDQGITATFQRENWYKTPSQGLYSFSVEPVGTGTVSEFPAFIDNIKSTFDTVANIAIGGGSVKFGEFNLPITPQEINQTEDFAVTLKPTQGGTVVNHSGNKYKTLSISGTTGIQPNRGLLGVYKGTGLAIGQPDQLQYRSGYEVFQHFRQWMRSYHEMKSKPGNEKMRMLWRNYKDWEFLYVEPLKFSMKRDANSPLEYNYFIQFKVLGVQTIEKPLLDLVVSKLDEISDALVNTYVLIKKNKSVTEYFTGVITDFEQSMNNLKFAIKSANKQDIKMAEFTPSDVKQLSFKEALQVLGIIGNAMVKSSTDTKSAEISGTASVSTDPAAAGLALVKLAGNASATNATSVKAQLNQLLETETALLTGVSLDTLPKAIIQSLAQKQAASALISKTQVGNIQAQAKDLSDKLSEALGLGDDTYNQLFGIVPTTGIESQSEVTDDQFEMLYALSQTVNAIDGILSSDDMFDTNSQLFKQSTATNGADSVGQGIFSFPDPNSGVKEGFLSPGTTLEDLALSELGSTSRWTEIAELNGLKAPYIIPSTEALSPNYFVQSTNFTDPTQIRDLQIGYFYLIPDTPSPTGAWSGKGNNITEFMGGDSTNSATWRFLFPDDETLIQNISSFVYYQFSDSEWGEVDPGEFNTDGLLMPGDRIKIPSSSAPPITTVIQGPRDNPYTNTLSSGEKSLGVDLRLTQNMDLDLTPSGDLNVAIGSDNGAQAIVLKLLYEKGSLKKFPSLGNTLTPGKKLPDIAVIRTDLTTSLLQDSRIKSVSKINLIQQSGTIMLSFDVLFNDIQQPIPVNIPV